MTIRPEVYSNIRRMYVEGHTLKHIAKTLGINRNTVAKYCYGAHPPQEIKPAVKRESPLSKLVEPLILECLRKNEELPRKQRMKAINIWRYLVEEKGIKIAESTVRHKVAELRQQNHDAFIPLEFEPGEVMQVDWGDARACLAGVDTPVSMFCAVLPYSYAVFVALFPNKSKEAFLMGHQLAFEFFGGVPCQCWYDNLKTAVLKGAGSSAVMQQYLVEFAAHYAFRAVFANPAAGWEKGAVENSVKLARSLALSPPPMAANFQELQELTWNRCLYYLQNHKIRDRLLTVREMFDREKSCLRPLPKVPMETGRVVRGKVNTDCTVWFERVKYSVPWSLAGRNVTVRATPFSVSIYSEGKLLAEHTRSYTVGDHQYQPEHYLELLERRPRAQDNAAPLKKGVWPKVFEEFRLLYQGDKLNQELVLLLRLSATVGKQKLLAAIAAANAAGRPSYESVCFYLQQSGMSVESPDRVTVQPVNLSRYDQLFGGDAENDNNG